jgi:uncharacterized protein (DUF362 family)
MANNVYIFRGKLSETLENLLRKDISLRKILESEDEIIIKPNFVVPRKISVTNIELIDNILNYCEINKVKVRIVEYPGMEFRPDNVVRVLELKNLIKRHKNLKIEIPPKEFIRIKSQYYLKEMLIVKDIFEIPLINIFKIKTHLITEVSLAAKNLMGILHPYTRNFMHIKGVNRCLLDVVETIRPSYNIGEAYPAMEGRGPAFGIPRYLNILVGGTDIISLDSFIVREIIKHPYLIDKIYYLKFYKKSNKMNYIVYGDRNAIIFERPFLLPNPSIFYKFFYNNMYLVNIFFNYLHINAMFNELLYKTKYFGNKPVIVNKKMLNTVNRNICPTQAINFNKATIDYKKCIMCMKCVDKYPEVFKISYFFS